MVDYLWDSYAIVELLRGSKNYSNLKDAPIVTTPFAVVEVCSILQKNWDWPVRETAEIATTLMESVLSPDGPLLATAAAWRLSNVTRIKHFSYADAVGYVIAQEKGLVFLTGDRAFSGLPEVEIRR